MPEVSILMPVYNGMPFLPEAVDSIRNQTLQDFILIVVNDGSTDESVEYLTSLRDQRIKIIHQSNQGLGAALNAGLTNCDTEFLARMDADDISLPARLEYQLNFLHKHKDIGLVGTQFAYFGASGHRGFAPPVPSDHETIYGDLFRCRQALCHPSIMCRTSILKQVGGYRIKGSGEDWDMFLMMGEACRMANLQEVLYLYRLNADSVSVKQMLEVRMRYNHACHCARRRTQGRREISFAEFVAEQSSLPVWQRAASALDVYALAQYRQSIAEILNSRWVIGYPRLVWAAISSPRWTFQRIVREVRKLRKSWKTTKTAN